MPEPEGNLKQLQKETAVRTELLGEAQRLSKDGLAKRTGELLGRYYDPYLDGKGKNPEIASRVGRFMEWVGKNEKELTEEFVAQMRDGKINAFSATENGFYAALGTWLGARYVAFENKWSRKQEFPALTNDSFAYYTSGGFLLSMGPEKMLSWMASADDVFVRGVNVGIHEGSHGLRDINEMAERRPSHPDSDTNLGESAAARNAMVFALPLRAALGRYAKKSETPHVELGMEWGERFTKKGAVPTFEFGMKREKQHEKDALKEEYEAEIKDQSLNATLGGTRNYYLLWKRFKEGEHSPAENNYFMAEYFAFAVFPWISKNLGNPSKDEMLAFTEGKDDSSGKLAMEDVYKAFKNRDYGPKGNAADLGERECAIIRVTNPEVVAGMRVVFIGLEKFVAGDPKAGEIAFVEKFVELMTKQFGKPYAPDIPKEFVYRDVVPEKSGGNPKTS